MNYYKIALSLAIIGLAIQIGVLVSPDEYYIFSRKDGVLKEGILFPIILFSWAISCFAGAFNYVYIEKLHLVKYIPIARIRKFLPSLLCIPACLSFLWFCAKIFF